MALMDEKLVFSRCINTVLYLEKERKSLVHQYDSCPYKCFAPFSKAPEVRQGWSMIRAPISTFADETFWSVELV